MFYEKSDAVERWWSGGRQGKIPGPSALFVGAGISIESSTGLPNGAELTRALVHHLLCDDAADEVLSAFLECAPVLGRSLPRLEHVLEKTCNPIDYEGFSRPGNPRNLLGLFCDRTPNRNHHLIAEHLRTHRGWCITTNFDDCIERASSFSVPVHVLNASGDGIRVLHSQHGTEWGLIKLHGTIEDGVDGLWATLADLQFGLPLTIRELLTEVMREVKVVVVAGYSGTDHFDVNHWIREHANVKPKATTPRLIWISHASNKDAAAAIDYRAEPHASWNMAFSGMACRQGPTNEILSDLLGQAPREATHAAPASLKNSLAQLYQPSDAEKHLNGARLAASIGLGQRAEEELRMLRHEIDDDKAAGSIEADIYFARGMTQEALKIRAYLDRGGVGQAAVSQTRMLRQQGRRIVAIVSWLLHRNARGEGKPCAKSAVDALACGLDIVENLQRFRFFRTGVARRRAGAFLDLLSVPAFRSKHEMAIDVQGKLQTQGLRRQALLSDDDKDRTLLGTLWRQVHEQYSRPDFYLESGPLIPGFFLIEQSTAREQDRLAELVNINLELANVLLSALRRRWPRGIADVERELIQEATGSTRADFSVGQICATVVFGLLSESTRIATALAENGLHICIASCWLRAEQILGGVSYWKSQRLYLPARNKRSGDVGMSFDGS